MPCRGSIASLKVCFDSQRKGIATFEDIPVTVSEDFVGTYEAPELRLTVGDDRVVFAPQGLNVYGAAAAWIFAATGMSFHSFGSRRKESKRSGSSCSSEFPNCEPSPWMNNPLSRHSSTS